MRRALAIAAVFAGLAWIERRRPLRAPTQPRGRRTATNLAFAGVTALAIGHVQSRVLGRATSLVEGRRLGLARRTSWLRRALGVVVLDYTLWHWHRMNHRIGWLWRVHAAHHVDPDLDASTALRFHPVEMLASIPFRVAQIVVFGIDRKTLVAWETATLLAIAFHHSNVRLPPALDRLLSFAIITPRLHGIHHSARPQRLNTNFGTLFSAWDFVHRSRETRLDQAQLHIGLPRTLGTGTPTLATSLAFPLDRELTAK